MSTHESPLDRETRLQAAAAEAERLGLPPGDPILDRERLLLRALRAAPAAQLPADFAHAVALRAQRLEARAAPEDWLMTLLLGGMGIGALAYLQPFLLAVLRSLRVEVTMPALPWPMLIATAVAIGVAWAVDEGATRLRRRH
jgi:hypothetical protein